ncbi:MAG: cell division protein ZapA [Ruminococcus sp.]|jgi:uncharacterized coiled-coil DUF342 family protein|nr:cell division protein ZapA [Ruminococcus sp.]
MPNKARIKVNGIDLAFNTDEDIDYINELERKLQGQIDDLRSKSNMPANTALLAVAFSLIDDLTKSNSQLSSLRSQIKEQTDKAGKAVRERDEVIKEINALKLQLKSLESRLLSINNK